MTDATEGRDKRWIALILLCSAQFVVVLDASIVNVALPTIGGALGLAVLAAIANSIIGNTRDPAVLTEGFQSAFLVGAAFAALGLLATLLLIRTADSRAHVELGAEPALEDAN